MTLERQLDLNTDFYLSLSVCVCANNARVRTHKQMYFMWKDWTLMSNSWQSAGSELSKKSHLRPREESSLFPFLC